MVVVKTTTLKAAMDRIIEKLNNENIQQVEIEADLYNTIPSNKWDITYDPDDVVQIGSLEDDVESIEKLVSDSTRVCTYVDFDRVSTILRAISQYENPPV
jgi:hypothetical protein